MTFAWSEEREGRARIWLLLALLGVIAGFLVGVAGCALKDWRYVLAACIIIFSGSVAHDKIRRRLDSMMANKPEHGAVGLTRWHWHAHYTSDLICDQCGRVGTFEGKQFFPRAEDPGGGRYSFVCDCGRGHYKFPVAVH